jgi:hypothetical protein
LVVAIGQSCRHATTWRPGSPVICSVVSQKSRPLHHVQRCPAVHPSRWTKLSHIITRPPLVPTVANLVTRTSSAVGRQAEFPDGAAKIDERGMPIEAKASFKKLTPSPPIGSTGYRADRSEEPSRYSCPSLATVPGPQVRRKRSSSAQLSAWA